MAHPLVSGLEILSEISAWRRAGKNNRSLQVRPLPKAALAHPDEGKNPVS